MFSLCTFTLYTVYTVQCNYIRTLDQYSASIYTICHNGHWRAAGRVGSSAAGRAGRLSRHTAKTPQTASRNSALRGGTWHGLGTDLALTECQPWRSAALHTTPIVSTLRVCLLHSLDWPTTYPGHTERSRMLAYACIPCPVLKQPRICLHSRWDARHCTGNKGTYKVHGVMVSPRTLDPAKPRQERSNGAPVHWPRMMKQ